MASIAAKVAFHRVYSDELVESVFSIVLLLPIELAFKLSMSPEINLRKQ